MKKTIVSIVMIGLSVFAGMKSFGQCKIKDGSVSSASLPAANTILDLESSNKAFLPPRVALDSTTDLRSVATPVDGMVVFNTNTSGTASATGVSQGLYNFSQGTWHRLAYMEPARGRAMVDSAGMATLNAVTLKWKNLDSAAGAAWHMPLGWNADKTLSVLPGVLQTKIHLLEAKSGQLLKVPDILLGTGKPGIAMEIKGLYFEGCNSPYSGYPYVNMMSIFILGNNMSVTLDGVSAGSIVQTNDVFTWTSPVNGCAYTRTFSYNRKTGVLSYDGGTKLSSGSGTKGTTTLIATATIYSDAY